MGCWTSTQCPASNPWLFYKNQFKHHPIQVYSHHFRCVEKKSPTPVIKKSFLTITKFGHSHCIPMICQLLLVWYLDHQTVCNWSIAEKLSPWFFLFFFTMFFLRISKFFLTFCWMFDNFQVCLKMKFVKQNNLNAYMHAISTIRISSMFDVHFWCKYQHAPKHRKG